MFFLPYTPPLKTAILLPDPASPCPRRISKANKNWMVKARVGSASAAAAIGIRAWFHPSFLLFGSVQYNYAGWGGTSGGGYGAAPSWTRVGDLPLRWGLVLQIENFGAMRYERGSQVGGQPKRHKVLSFCCSMVSTYSTPGVWSPLCLSTPPGLSQALMIWGRWGRRLGRCDRSATVEPRRGLCPDHIPENAVKHSPLYLLPCAGASGLCVAAAPPSH